jgi:hypothetical protein
MQFSTSPLGYYRNKGEAPWVKADLVMATDKMLVSQVRLTLTDDKKPIILRGKPSPDRTTIASQF